MKDFEEISREVRRRAALGVEKRKKRSRYLTGTIAAAAAVCLCVGLSLWPRGETSLAFEDDTPSAPVSLENTHPTRLEATAPELTVTVCAGGSEVYTASGDDARQLLEGLQSLWDEADALERKEDTYRDKAQRNPDAITIGITGKTEAYTLFLVGDCLTDGETGATVRLSSLQTYTLLRLLHMEGA